MGNYGNTLDRWYRRAAVVVWPRDRAFAARAEAGSQWALHQLRDRIEAGDLDGARAAAESLAPFWKTVGAQPGLLGCGPGRGGGPGRGRDGSDAAGAVPYRDGRAGACGRAGGGGRAVRRRMDAERRRWVVRAGAPLRNRAVRVGRQPAVGAVRGAPCRREADSGAAAGRRSLAPDGQPAPTLDPLRASRDPPATAGDAELAAGATAGGGRRRTPRRDHCERCARTGTTWSSA